MTYTSAEGRQQILQTVAGAAEEIGAALADLGEAYEQLDERAAERLETELFRPVQVAYGRAQSTHAGFAARSSLPGHDFQANPASAPGGGAKHLIEGALVKTDGADRALAELQDSMLPVEVGDAELRAGISGVRELLGGLRGRARELLRTFGR
jgi:hypothetical protein